MNLSYRAKHNLAVIATRAVALAFVAAGAAFLGWGFDHYFGIPFHYAFPAWFVVIALIEIYEDDTLPRSFRRRLIKRGE